MLLAIGPGTGMIVAFLLIILALVYYLVSTIFELQKITTGLDATIKNVTEIVEKTAPVGEVVRAINADLDAGVDMLEGLLVKKAGVEDAVGLVDGLYPGAAAAGLRNFPESTDDRGAADRRGVHEGHADARPARPRGTDRDGQSGRSGAPRLPVLERIGAESSTTTSATRGPRSCRARR